MCHRLFHAGIVEIPSNPTRFDEEYVEYRNSTWDECPMCGKPKRRIRKTCSLKCAGKLNRKVNWDHINLKKCLKIIIGVGHQLLKF
jgi:hypothetical protein